MVERKKSSTRSKRRENQKAGLKEYRPTGTYKIGQKIYHPVFEDVGRVVKKKEATGEYRKIVVDFKHRGQKTLIEKKSVRKAKLGDTVLIHYAARLEDGNLIESTKNEEPVELTIGEGTFPPYLEEKILGMIEDGFKVVTLPSSEAYGCYRKDLVFDIAREDMNVDKPRVGRYYKVRSRKGDIVEARCVRVDEATVTFDANHPLAGKDIIYEMTLLELMAG